MDGDYVRNAALIISKGQSMESDVKLTRNDVTRVHGILVLDEAKAVHQFDLSDLTGAMGLEVALDFCLGGIARKIA